MSFRYFATIPDKCAMLNTYARKVCLPVRIDCGTPPDGLVVDCGLEHNCSECCNNPAYLYYQPFEWGDCIDIQLQVFDKYNANPKQPSDGFGSWIEIVTIDLTTGQEVASVYDKAYVGWNGKNSYQVIRICFIQNELPECVQFKFNIYDSEDELVKSLCTQHFRLAESCKTSVLLGSKRTGYDCEDNYYGLPEDSQGDTPFAYNNTLRFYADINDAAPIRETITRGGIARKSLVKYIKEYAIYFVPLYVVKYITDRIDNGGKIEIDGKTYEVAEFSDIEQIPDTCMYNIRINIIYECTETNC